MEEMKLVINFKYNCNMLNYPFFKTIEENIYEKFEEISTKVLEHLLDKSIDAIYFSPPKMRLGEPYFISWCNIDQIYIFESSLSFYDKVEYDKFMKTLEENGWILKHSKKHDVKK